jgi:L,D-transpeptidase YcbB
MKSIFSIVFLLFAVFSSATCEPARSIKQFIDNMEGKTRYEVDNEYLLSGNMLSTFYVNRIYAPAWFNQNNFSGKGYALLDYIRQSGRHGLNPEDYHLCLIEKYTEKLQSVTPLDTTEITKLDFLLTDAFMMLGSNLYFGKVAPEKGDVNWKIQQKDSGLRLDLKLEESLASNDIAGALDKLAPGYSSYWKMKEKLQFFLRLNGSSWPEIISDITIKPGDSNRLIPLIRERLIRLRYHLSDSISEIYDEELEKELKLFQNDYGMNADGAIGKSTLEDLNSLPSKLIDQLKVNMERFRWLPLQLTGKYIIINIANFKLDYVSGTDTLISMRAVVGTEKRATPIFNDRISYIVFSPSWTVPQTILSDDVIPELLKGPDYLKKRNMKLFRPDGTELVYADIDWTAVSNTNFPYKVRQEPGPRNALGRVKFMFPNSYSVYIHDTPSKGPFSRDNRAVSSGCIRVEKPFDLAVLLLSDCPEWSPGNIRKAMHQDKEQTVLLKTPVDVVLIYLTAWTDGNDRLQLRRDIYGRDPSILKALN